MKILYFAWLREKIGTAQEHLSLPAEVRTVGNLVAWLSARGPGYALAFSQPQIIRCAVDREFAGMDAPIEAAAEIAFFPPVTGG
jgi:molybdopterin synthase sulfur carrier subunit